MLVNRRRRARVNVTGGQGSTRVSSAFPSPQNGNGTRMAAPPCKRTLTYEEFESYAKEIYDVSERLRDGWELRSMQPTKDSKKTVFLVKKCTQLIGNESTGSDLEDARELKEELQWGGASVGDYCDPADAIQIQNDPASFSISHPRTVHLEYHVLYSLSYAVPVLYFTASYDSGKQLPLEDTWHHLVSRVHSSGETDGWAQVTQQEHPLLGRPFYHVHPCHTAEVMAHAEGRENGVTSPQQPLQNADDDHGMSLESRDLNYLLTWLSTFGPLVGLGMPLAYAELLAVDSSS